MRSGNQGMNRLARKKILLKQQIDIAYRAQRQLIQGARYQLIDHAKADFPL
jgi:hypothetical protein